MFQVGDLGLGADGLDHLAPVTPKQMFDGLQLFNELFVGVGNGSGVNDEFHGSNSCRGKKKQPKLQTKQPKLQTKCKDARRKTGVVCYGAGTTNSHIISSVMRSSNASNSGEFGPTSSHARM
jgi:hypothetical protein